MSFSEVIDCQEVDRLYENDIERENLWWSPSNKLKPHIVRAKNTWKSDSVYRWTIDQQAWVDYDDELTRELCEELLSKLISKLNENDSTSE